MAKKQKKRQEKSRAMHAEKSQRSGKYGNNIILKIKDVLTSPNKFFENIKKEKSFSASFIYFAVINVIILGLWRVNFLSLKLSMKHPGFNDMMGGARFWAIWIIIRVAGIFVMAYSLHICVKLFTRKSHSFIDSFKVMVYGETPYAILGWVSPIIFGIWSIALYIKGAMKSFDFSVMESVCVLALTVIIGAVVIALGSMIAAFPFVR